MSHNGFLVFIQYAAYGIAQLGPERLDRELFGI